MKYRLLAEALARWYLGIAFMVMLVLAPLTIVFFASDSLAEGLSRLWAIYHPLNYANWLTIIVALLPGFLLGFWARIRGR